MKSKLERWRYRFQLFNILNACSFMLLSGNIPTLFAINMGATGTYIGILGSLNFITYFFMPLGRRAICGRQIIKVFGWSWMLRYWGMIPVLIAPLLAHFGNASWGLLLLLLGSLVFNIFRGIGLIGNNPVLGMMAGDKDRGAFLSSVQIYGSLVAIGTSASTMFVLAKWSGNGLYAVLIGLGILLGTLGSTILLGLPEPESYRPPLGSSFITTIKNAWSDKRLRQFVMVFTPLSFSAGTARTFIVTHARVLYKQSPGAVMAYSVAFNIGSVAVGYLSRKLMDRLGAKPLYIVFTALLVVAIIPAIWNPVIESGTMTFLFLFILNFLIGFGISGEENAGQTYFFSIVKPELMLDLAIIYYVVYGLGGSLGSMAGGIFLDTLSVVGVDVAVSYRFLYIVVLVITAASAFGARKLTSPEAVSVRESLGVLFSMRDLKTIGLLERLEKTGSPIDEIKIIKKIGISGLSVAEKELLPYLSSPRFDVRIEALRALENLDKLSDKALKAISGEIEKNPYTTAYIAAQILEKHFWKEGLTLLRSALDAEDYMLRCSAVSAIATMNDEASLPKIEDIITETDNPRLMITSASALEVFGKTSSVPVLVALLKRKGPPPYAFDEIVLSIAGILGGLHGFYSVYSSFSLNAAEALETLFEYLEKAPSMKPDFKATLSDFVYKRGSSPAIARMLTEADFLGIGLATIFAEAALDDDLASHMGFRFFLVACVIESEFKKYNAKKTEPDKKFLV